MGGLVDLRSLDGGGREIDTSEKVDLIRKCLLTTHSW